MAKINFFRGSTTQISSIPVADGQIVFDTDKRTICMDYFNNRLVMGSAFEYFYPVVTEDMWVENTAFIEYPNAIEYNILIGVPNPTSIENIELVRDSAISISAVSEEGVTIRCINLPADTVQLAMQLSDKIKEVS